MRRAGRRSGGEAFGSAHSVAAGFEAQSLVSPGLRSRARGWHSALGLGLTWGTLVARAPEPLIYFQYNLLNLDLLFSLRNRSYSSNSKRKTNLSISVRIFQCGSLSINKGYEGKGVLLIVKGFNH